MFKVKFHIAGEKKEREEDFLIYAQAIQRCKDLHTEGHTFKKPPGVHDERYKPKKRTRKRSR